MYSPTVLEVSVTVAVVPEVRFTVNVPYGPPKPPVAPTPEPTESVTKSAEATDGTRPSNNSARRAEDGSHERAHCRIGKNSTSGQHAVVPNADSIDRGSKCKSAFGCYPLEDVAPFSSTWGKPVGAPCERLSLKSWP